MEQHRRVSNLIIAILLTTASIHFVSSSQNLSTLTTIDSIGSDRFTDNVSQPLSTTTLIPHDFTTYSPASTTIPTEEILDSAETNTLNRYSERQKEKYREKDDEPEESPDHAIPYSEHEEARNVSTRPKYIAPGVWAKPPPGKNIPLDFIPSKLHAQVRGTHTVKRLPQREAIKSAKTNEEKHNALRLREVVTNSKVNTVYSEEGYEDSAYDHAGHIRDADFHEGFARKLHDQENKKLNSSSDKKKKEKRKNLVSDEFKEYEDDYQDYSKMDGKASNDENNLTGYGRSIWEGSEIDPKLVTKNGIRELEEDIEEDAEETERSSKNYQNTQESKLRNDVKNAEEESHSENDLKDEENKINKIKEKKPKLQNEKDDSINKETKQSASLKKKKKKNLYRENQETTATPSDEASSTDAKISANSYGFLTTPSYSFDQTTLRYVAPIMMTLLHQVDDQPTTINYSQLFWNYFKAKQGLSTTESPVLVPDSTTMNPRPEERTPIALTTIDGHGPYFPVTKSDDVDNVYVNNVVSTVATYTSVQPVLLQSLPSLDSENTEYSSPTSLLDSITSSTPAVITLNMTQEAYARLPEYSENPFLGSVLDNSQIAVTKNKIKYKIALRPKSEKKPNKPVAYPSSSKKENEKKKIRLKKLNYIKSKQKIVFPEDLTLLRPPTLYQATYSIFSTGRPAGTDRQSSVFIDSEPPRETNWRNLLQDNYHSQPIAELPVRLIYRYNPLPATKLLPPPLNTYANYHNDWQNDNYPSYAGGKPQQKRDNAFKYFPLISKESWRTRSRRKRSEFRNDTAVDVKAVANNGVSNDDESEQRDKDTFDGTTDRSKGKSSNQRAIDAPDTTRLRHGKNETKFTTLTDKKATNGENENVKEAKIIYNLTSNEKNPIIDGYENDTNVQNLTAKTRNFEERLRRNSKSTINHEELLNESAKINSDVIDKEIATRFNDNNETSEKIEEQGKIEAEVPSFDYIEELAEDSLVEPSTTTEAVIDSKKYPFYNNGDLPVTSALKYVVDPSTIPRKTSRGMEFYKSRNAYKKCDEVEPNVDKVLPEKEEPDPERGPRENLPHLRGLGDKLDCFKAKYFDENPLDNPLFAEKLIQEPTPPSELNPAKFVSRIMVLPKESDEYVVHQVSKKPERSGRQWRNRNRPYEMHESINVNYKHDPRTGRGRNAYLHTVRGSRPLHGVRRVKNRKLKPRASSTTTQLPKMHQIASYQNEVYEDVMGNIRNLANAYQVYEITTLPPSAIQIAGSEKTLKTANVTMNSFSKENDTSSSAEVNDVTDITDVTSNTKSSEIKGLVPPPKYSAPRKTSYRKYRPLGKRRVSLLRASNLPHRIIAHHHIKINKRSTTDDAAKNFSENTTNKDEMTTTEESVKINIGNDTVVKSTEVTMRETTSTPETLDLDIKESRQINTQGSRILSTTLKINKKRQRNSTNSDEMSKPSDKVIYTIRDRIKHSKPKSDTRGFDKFNTSKTVNEDSRRKEPRYNYLKKKKKLNNDGNQNNSTIMNSTENTFENTMSSTEGGESTTEVYRIEESVVRQTIYSRKAEYPEGERSDDETEHATNTYQVHENINEEHDFTTTRPSNSKKVQNLREFLESDPPGYSEAFPEEATTLSSKYRTDVNHELEDDEEEQEEETDNPKNAASSWDDDFSERTEEQVETPKTELFDEDDDSEEPSSREEEASDRDQTFFTYTKRPLLTKKEKDDELFERRRFYRPFPFSRYKSKFKKKSDEEDDSEEESEEKNDDYVFPWHADKENEEDKRKWLQDVYRYEYPWERRERQARERRIKRKRANRLKKLFNDEDEEESVRYERPVYPWERYDVPSNTHRRDISGKYVDDSEESATEKQQFPKFSSRYSSSDGKPSKSNAGEISRSIKKLLEEDVDDDFNEKTLKKIEDHPSTLIPPKSSPSPDREIFKETPEPEDITQSPRRKDRRRKTSRVDKNVSNNSRFDSRKLKSSGISNGKEEEKPVEYRKLNRSNDSESRLKTVNKLPNNTKEASSATEYRKHRQRISRNNSRISLTNNAPVEPINEPVKKRRRKPQALKHQASISPSSKVDLDTSKSVFTPVRKRYSKADEAAKTNTSDSFKESTTKTIQTDNLETSTPKTQTIEHLSKVSKQKIITKITYPNEAENFYPANVTLTRKEPGEKLKSRRRKNFNVRKDNNRNSSDKEKLIERKAGKRDHDIKFANTDEIKNSAISEKSLVKNKDPFKNFELRKDEIKKINDYSTYDGIDENDSDNDSFQMSQAYVVSNLLRNIPPNRIRNDQDDDSELSGINGEWEKQYSNDGTKRKKDMEETRKSLLQTKFIKDPERRLYYYVERK